MAGKPIGIVIVAVAYFFLYSAIGLIELAKGISASPQWLFRRLALPEERVAQDLGDPFVELWRASKTGDETVCISLGSYQEIVASRSAFVPYFIQTRRLSTRCERLEKQ